MLRRIEKFLLVGQVIFSAAIIVFGAATCVRCLLGGLSTENIIFATLCAALAYVSGYRFLFRASLRELREFNNEERRPET